MEISVFLSSLNKISLVVFFITFGFLIYEIYLFRKEVFINKSKPKIPNFVENKDLIIGNNIVINKEKKQSIKKPNKIFLIAALIIFIFSGIILALNFFTFQQTNFLKNSISPTPIINFITSEGIKIYNQNWEEIEREELGRLSFGQTIYIALKKINDPNIDKARIRVNKNRWEIEDITSSFNKEKNVFYREYTISSNEALLKIEAQFHSTIDGWLGE